MLASGNDPARARDRSRPHAQRVGEVRLSSDAVAQHRLRVLHIAGEPALRCSLRPEAGSTEAAGLPERLDVRLPGGPDRPCAKGVRGGLGVLPERQDPPLRDDVARRTFCLQIDTFRPTLPEPKRPRFLPEPPALVPLLARGAQPLPQLVAKRSTAVEGVAVHVAL